MPELNDGEYTASVLLTLPGATTDQLLRLKPYIEGIRHVVPGLQFKEPKYNRTARAMIGERASVHVAEVLAERLCVEWLLEDQLERNVIAVMSGPRGSYKSAISLDWIMHVCVVLREPVLWLTAEGTGTQRRVAGWLKTHAPDVDAANIPLRVVPRRHDLNDQAGLDVVAGELGALAQEYGQPAALCVADTYSKYSATLDENSNSDVKAYLTRIDAQLRQPHRCTILLIAHTGLSDKKRARGASALEADTDACYIVSRANGVVSMTRERFKDSPELPPLHFTPDIIELGYNDARDKPVTAVVMKPAERVVVNASTAKEPRGPNKKLLRSLLAAKAPHGDWYSIAELIALALAARKKAGLSHGADAAKNLRRSLTKLSDAGSVEIDADKVRLCGVVPAAPGTRFEA